MSPLAPSGLLGLSAGCFEALLHTLMNVLIPCSPDQQFCWEEFTGNTMVQHDLMGNMLFLHTNLSPKWNLHIPGDFRGYSRRRVVQPLIQTRFPCISVAPCFSSALLL